MTYDETKTLCRRVRDLAAEERYALANAILSKIVRAGGTVADIQNNVPRETLHNIWCATREATA